MKILISPAKSLKDIVTSVNYSSCTQPQFIDRAEELIQIMQTKSSAEIASMMNISDKLSNLNRDRFKTWTKIGHKSNGSPAAFVFDGDVYKGLDIDSFSKEDVLFAQDVLRSLSGLYGILKPLDNILPYRLEMGSKVENSNGNTLYKFWGDSITDFINSEETDVLINLASNEYFKVINRKKIDAKIVTPEFKELRGDRLKVISFSAKKARGLMSRYIIQNRITEVEQIKNFDVENYRFSEELSDENSWVFTR